MTKEMDPETMIALIKATDLIRKSGGSPQNAFVAGYGQIIRDGKPTPEGIEWWNDLMKKEKGEKCQN